MWCAMEYRVRYSAIDLFGGCGGLSLGLRRAGFRVLVAVDNDGLAVKTYGLNHRRTRVIESDIRAVDPGVLMEELNLNAGDLDLLAGCPPCQGFSRLRTCNGGRRVEEPMNDLVFEFVRFARMLLPRAIMMENVPALRRDARLDSVQRELRALGYEVRAEVFDANDYGVPQRRLRMILVGGRGGCPAFAAPRRRRRTVVGAIGRVPLPEGSEDLVHNYCVERAEHVNVLIDRIPKDGGSRGDLPDEEQLDCHRGFDGFNDVYGRYLFTG